jgi:hypothetical protein
MMQYSVCSVMCHVYNTVVAKVFVVALVYVQHLSLELMCKQF